MDYLQLPTGSLELDEHVQHIQNVDWAATPLGPLEKWPKEIALLIYQAMIDLQPKLLLLGPDLNMLYNPAYARLFHEYHPALLGRPVIDGWATEKDAAMKSFDAIRRTGRPYIQPDYTLISRHNGTSEEIILRWYTMPLKGPFPGFFASLTDVTEATVAEQRRILLKSLSISWNNAVTMSAWFTELANSLSNHPQEFPFALLYTAAGTVREPGTSQPFDVNDASRFNLRNYVGDPSVRPLIHSVLDLGADTDPLSEVVRGAIASGKQRVLLAGEDDLPEAWVRAAAGRGFGDKLNSAVICPIHSDRSSKTIAILVTGLNPRRKWNDSYQSWIAEVSRELGHSARSVHLIEEETRKQHESAQQAAQAHVMLEKELATRQKEVSSANDKAKRLLKMMEGCDVGIFEYAPDGTLVQANESWYRLSGYPKDRTLHPKFKFMELVYPPDEGKVMDAWNRISAGFQISFEMRWKPQPPGPGEEAPTDGQWVLSTCVPAMDEDGKLISISGCTTDISAQKRVEQDALRRAEALERARASEREASRANEQFRRMNTIIAEIDVGVFEYNADGRLAHANDAYFKLTGMDKDYGASDAFKFSQCIHPDDYERVMGVWNDLVSGHAINFEMRWKAPQKVSTTGEDPGQWVLAACVPVTDEQGKVTSLYGCITDIDPQKRSENETLKRAEALERARASEHRFVRFTESATTAIYIVDYSSRALTYCNNAWFELTGTEPVEDTSKIDWAQIVHEEDLPLVDRAWHESGSKKDPVSVQFRLRRLWKGSKDEAKLHIWVLAVLNSEFNDDGSITSIMGTMSDITGFKFAESVQQMRIDEAIEAKRQQENFIDMTSHEIRNPLGAVVHCADSIADSLAEMKTLVKSMQRTEDNSFKQLAELIESSTEAVNIITSCTAHQKRIVDDILVLSKLDSNLLQIAPLSVQAIDILRDVQKMFEAEAQRVGVDVRTEADVSLETLKVEYAFLDPGRALQILINLVTNAIKFTKNRQDRTVTIRMGASAERPSESELNVDFALSHSMRDSIYDTIEFADNTFYLWFTVHDTGRGMTPEEKARIFSRFSQGSPRTYSEYGGSGLGLFISRELAGLQGGEIGVATESGKGSTFAFFVKTRHTKPNTIGPAGQALRDQPSKINGHAKEASTNGINSSGTPHEAKEAAVTTMKTTDIGILVTEDNLLNQKVLKKQLTKHGYKVYTADNGQEALDFLKTTRRWKGGDDASCSPSSSSLSTTTTTTNADQPAATQAHDISIILMDIEMPLMDGITAAREIRALQASGHIASHIPIIAVSANARAEQTNAAIAAGMDDAIAKPFRIADLIPKIERLARWSLGV